MSRLDATQKALAHAMSAKSSIFQAQDAAGYIEDAELRTQVEQMLLKVRGELEGLDRIVSDYRIRRSER